MIGRSKSKNPSTSLFPLLSSIIIITCMLKALVCYPHQLATSNTPSRSTFHSSSTTMSIKTAGFKSSALLEQVNEQLISDAAFANSAKEKIGATVVFTVKNKKGDVKSWLLDFKNEGKISQIDNEDSRKYDSQVLVSDNNLKKLVEGKTSAQSLFLQGSLKLKGNVAKAAKVDEIFKSKAKL